MRERDGGREAGTQEGGRMYLSHRIRQLIYRIRCKHELKLATCLEWLVTNKNTEMLLYHVDVNKTQASSGGSLQWNICTTTYSLCSLSSYLTFPGPVFFHIKSKILIVVFSPDCCKTSIKALASVPHTEAVPRLCKS